MVSTILLWIILGFIAGTLAAFALGTDKNMSYATNIFVGVVGAVIAGLAIHLAGIRLTLDLNNISILLAVVGSAILIGLVRTAKTTIH
jgi:uncharacterized membrane protein YeaQ/YmgE (transglycosylase-associated protein family)